MHGGGGAHVYFYFIDFFHSLPNSLKIHGPNTYERSFASSECNGGLRAHTLVFMGYQHQKSEVTKVYW